MSTDSPQAGRPTQQSRERVHQQTTVPALRHLQTPAGQVEANPLAVNTAHRRVLGSSPFRSFTHKRHEYPHEDHLQNKANHDNHVSEQTGSYSEGDRIADQHGAKNDIQSGHRKPNTPLTAGSH